MQDFSKSEVHQVQQAVVLGIQKVPQQGLSSVPAESALTIFSR
jgi:hypothetical protein